MSALHGRVRHFVIEALRLLASPERQRQYQTEVPHVNVVTEMLCFWGDHYLPDSVKFQAAFSYEERRVLQDFDDVVKLVCHQQRAGSPPLEEFIYSAGGSELAMIAQKILAKMAPLDEVDR